MHLLVDNWMKWLTIKQRCSLSPIVLSVIILQSVFFSSNTLAQCSATLSPTYSESCLYDYFTSVSAFGTGITSTISVSATSCSVTATDLYTSQGLHAPIGSTVNIDIQRCVTLYTAFLSVFVDWNNDGMYDATELAGSMIEVDRSATSATYSFTVPDCGVTTGTPLHMRLMLTESDSGTGAPCTANYGESLDFYFEAICPAPMGSISITPASSTVCQGTNTTLTATGGVGTAVYSWTPATGLSATTGSSVTASPATTTIYTVSVAYCSGCGTSSAATATMTVLPAATISSPGQVCVGVTTSLSASISGGTWTFSNPAIATVHPTAGTITGISGTYIGISGTLAYHAPNGCITSGLLPVMKSPPPIIGATTVCEGGSIVLSDTASLFGTHLGSWKSGNTTVAIVSSTSGVATAVTGISVGTALISFQFQGCYATTSVTVFQGAGTISGASTVCIGATVTLSSSSAGGTWGGGSGVAAVNSSTGAVTGGALGSAVISYTQASGCVATKTISVTGPSAIGGSPVICTGSTRTLSNATGGGIWTSSNTSVATVSASGIVTPINTGSTNISYTIGGCTATTSATVFATPSAISGNNTVCTATILVLSNAVGGGIWSTSNGAVGSISHPSTEVVIGVSAGTATITYATGGGTCLATYSITVKPTPPPIIGLSSVCVGSFTNLSNTLAGGVWSSSNTADATVSGSGVVSGVSTGAANISYTVAGCGATTSMSVYLAPSSISGPTSVCGGSTIPLSNTVAGGAWSSSNSTVATVGSSSGLVTGSSSGAAIITYSMGGICIATRSVTVNVPSAITGTTTVCSGAATQLSNAAAGGAWSSSSSAIATVSASGLVSAVAAGSANISYIISGCTAVTSLTVYQSPGAISGLSSVCGSRTFPLSNPVAGGVWSSSETSLATVDAGTGVVNTLFGAIPGIPVVITYVKTGGCFTNYAIVVNGIPPAISGSTGLCVGATSILSNTVAGGNWSSSNSSVATITAGGTLAGAATGASTVSYTISGCAATASVTIFNTPTVISGLSSLCAGTTIPLSNSVPGGTWSSSSNARATVGATTGVVTGVSAGSVTITYSLGGTCRTTTTLTVNSPGAIVGSRNVSLGFSSPLSCGTGGGIWSSTNSGIATISSVGVLHGAALGTTTISYTAGGCSTVATATVSPAPGAITGPGTLCSGPIALTNSVTGGTWSSSNTTIATVSTGGIVYGVAMGSVTITYITPGGGYATTSITISAPGMIRGTPSACVGGTTTLSCVTAGGVWTSSNNSIATVTSGGGIVSAVSAGTATVTYTAGGCFSTINVVISAPPNPTITGPSTVCTGTLVTFANSVSGGTWSSSNSSRATISASSGISSPLSAGSVTISYTTGPGCIATKAVTVSTSPVPITGTYITSASGKVCVGNTMTVADATGGGAWSSSNTAIVTVSSGGVITGVAAGTAVVSYTVGSCVAGVSITVYNVPSAITGLSALCMGSTTVLSVNETGGTWSSSAPAKATVNPVNGTTYGVAAGSSTITYTSPGRCFVTKSLTIDSSPTVTGASSMTINSYYTFTVSPAGGVWSSYTPAIATVNVAGVVHAVAAGTVTISNTQGACAPYVVVTVH